MRRWCRTLWNEEFGVMNKTVTPKHTWTFAPRFRAGAFGWRSEPAITRIKEAVSEIKAIAKKNPLLGAEGAILFLQKLSPALQNIDGSSGAIGTAANRAIEAVVPIIAKAPVDISLRRKWLEKLYQAHADDQIPYIESLADYWGELCASQEIAAEWADRLAAHLLDACLDADIRRCRNGAKACIGIPRPGRAHLNPHMFCLVGTPTA